MVVAILIWAKDWNGLFSCFLYLCCVASWEVGDPFSPSMVRMEGELVNVNVYFL